MKKLQRGENVWVNAESGERVNSPTRPTGEYWFAAYALSRICDATYRPYRGISEWVRAANADMADAAQYNFKNK